MEQFEVLEESEIYPGYYFTPVSSKILVSKDGHVVDAASNICILPRMISWGYYVIDIMGEGAILLHRLLAITFIKTDGIIEELTVNHKDGIKTNYHLDNLEWCTASENALHAYISGLREDNRPIVVKDLRTDNVTRYYSLQACSRFFNCNAEQIHRYLKTLRVVPFKLYFSLTYEGSDWPVLTKEDIGKMPTGHASEIVVEHVGKAFFEIFPSMGSASKKLGLNRNIISPAIINGAEYKGLRFHHLTNFDGTGKNVTKAEVEVYVATMPKRKPLAVKVTNIFTGLSESLESVEEFAKRHSAKKNTIQKSMLLNQGMWKVFKIEYI